MRGDALDRKMSPRACDSNKKNTTTRPSMQHRNTSLDSATRPCQSWTACTVTLSFFSYGRNSCPKLTFSGSESPPRNLRSCSSGARSPLFSKADFQWPPRRSRYLSSSSPLGFPSFFSPLPLLSYDELHSSHSRRARSALHLSPWDHTGLTFHLLCLPPFASSRPKVAPCPLSPLPTRTSVSPAPSVHSLL